MEKLKESVWYRSTEPAAQLEYRMKVAKLLERSLIVVDEQGQRRTVNRWLFETTMQEVRK